MDNTSAPLPRTKLAKTSVPVLGSVAEEVETKREFKSGNGCDEDFLQTHTAPPLQAIAVPVVPATTTTSSFEGFHSVDEPGAYRRRLTGAGGIPRNEICSAIKSHMYVYMSRTSKDEQREIIKKKIFFWLFHCLEFTCFFLTHLLFVFGTNRSPLFTSWGLRVIELQINRIELADARYAAEYESSSLTVAKTKADARAQEAKNFVIIASAEAAAAKRMLEVKAEVDAQLALATAQAQAKIILARATAEATELEADGRNKAAAKLSDPFAKRVLVGEQDIAKSKALSNLRSLVVQPNSPLVAFGGAAVGAIADDVAARDHH